MTQPAPFTVADAPSAGAVTPMNEALDRAWRWREFEYVPDPKGTAFANEMRAELLALWDDSMDADALYIAYRSAVMQRRAATGSRTA